MLNQSVVLTNISDTIKDISNAVTDIHDSGKSITLTTNDSIFIGTKLPFNNLYLKFDTNFNTNASNLSVSFWDGSRFYDFYKVVDGTSLSGACLGQNGTIQLIPTNEVGPNSYDSKYISELKNVDGYYDYFWTRLNFSANLTQITLKYVGQLFLESDIELTTFYPDLKNTNYMKIYDSLKTDWLEQRLIATDEVINELVSRGYVSFGEQFLDWRLMKEVTIHKTASIIYRGLGPKLRDDAKEADSLFLKSLDSRKFGINKKANALKDNCAFEDSKNGFYR